MLSFDIWLSNTLFMHSSIDSFKLAGGSVVKNLPASFGNTENRFVDTGGGQGAG